MISDEMRMGNESGYQSFKGKFKLMFDKVAKAVRTDRKYYKITKMYKDGKLIKTVETNCPNGVDEEVTKIEGQLAKVFKRVDEMFEEISDMVKKL